MGPPLARMRPLAALAKTTDAIDRVQRVALLLHERLKLRRVGHDRLDGLAAPAAKRPVGQGRQLALGSSMWITAQHANQTPRTATPSRRSRPSVRPSLERLVDRRVGVEGNRRRWGLSTYSLNCGLVKQAARPRRDDTAAAGAKTPEPNPTPSKGRTSHARTYPPPPSPRPTTASVEDDVHAHWQRVVGRRSFLKGVGLAGAAALPGSALFAGQAFAQSTRITAGDVAILRFLAAAELIESRSVVSVRRARWRRRRQRRVCRRASEPRHRHAAVHL